MSLSPLNTAFVRRETVVQSSETTLPLNTSTQEEMAFFEETSRAVAQKFHEVVSRPADFFTLAMPLQPDDCEFIRISVEIPPSETEGEPNEKVQLNFMLASGKKVESIYQAMAILWSSFYPPEPFAFRRHEFATSQDTMISFPNNELLNALLARVPRIFSCALRSTYQMVGKVPHPIFVRNWVYDNAWPYDGEADSLARMKDTLHDAEHIVASLSSSHLLANTKIFLRQHLQKMDPEQLVEEETVWELSGTVENLHNYACDLETKCLRLTPTHIVWNFTGSSGFSGTVKASDLPVPLEESEENCNERIDLFWRRIRVIK